MLYDEHRKIVYKPYNNCISSVQNLIRTLLSFLYQLELGM